MTISPPPYRDIPDVWKINGLEISNSEFCRDWDAGVPTTQIAERYGVSKSAACYHAKRLGLEGRKAGRPSAEALEALTDGEWVADDRGIKHWVARAS